MALSEHEDRVLEAMEAALRTEATRARATGRPVGRPASSGSRRAALGAVGLALAGAATVAVGPLLADNVGTGLGVLGFLLLTTAGWRATPLLTSLRHRRRTCDAATSDKTH